MRGFIRKNWEATGASIAIDATVGTVYLPP